MDFNNTLFSDRSLLTMLHGIALSGGAMVAIAAALFHMYAVRGGGDAAAGGDCEHGAARRAAGDGLRGFRVQVAGFRVQ